MTIRAERLSDTFAVLTPEKAVHPVALTAEFYERLELDYGRFGGHVLVSRYCFTEDWPSWERHPAGDELVILLSGHVELRLQRSTGEDSIELGEPGSYVVMPRATWHTARVPEAATMLFVTPGEGIENRARV